MNVKIIYYCYIIYLIFHFVLLSCDIFTRYQISQTLVNTWIVYKSKIKRAETKSCKFLLYCDFSVNNVNQDGHYSWLLFKVSDLARSHMCNVQRSVPLSGVSLMAQHVMNLPAMQETHEMRVPSLSQKDPLEMIMATHSSILTWRILWTEEPRGLQSKAWQRVGRDWVTEPTAPLSEAGCPGFPWLIGLLCGLQRAVLLLLLLFHCRRASFYACRLDKHLYVIGGRNETGYLSSVECYNLETNEWRYVSSLPQPLAAHAGAVHNGKIYISGKSFLHLLLQSSVPRHFLTCVSMFNSQGVYTMESMSRGYIAMTPSWMSGLENKIWTQNAPSTLWL